MALRVEFQNGTVMVVDYDDKGRLVVTSSNTIVIENNKHFIYRLTRKPKIGDESARGTFVGKATGEAGGDWIMPYPVISVRKV